MPSIRNVITVLALGTALMTAGERASAADDKPIPVVASFSILGDFVKEVGGDRVDVKLLVGPNGDPHVFSPSPADAKNVAEAKLVFVNGLGLEGWMDRLVQASGGKATLVVATKGIKARHRTKDEPQDDDEADAHEAHGHGAVDPHAWQSVANAGIYVKNIRDALDKADPAGKATYDANAAAYLAKLSAVETEVKAAMAKIPSERRRIITSHDAFGYFGDAYGLKLLAPQGVSTESEPSAKDVAAIIKQIKAEKVPAVFLENISDPRLVEQIASESGAKVGGTLYSDALSPPDGEAGTYIAMVQHNIKAFDAALMP